jgi:hypothetical protein
MLCLASLLGNQTILDSPRRRISTGVLRRSWRAPYRLGCAGDKTALMKKFLWPFLAFFAANWGAEMVYKNQVHPQTAPMWVYGLARFCALVGCLTSAKVEI